jgi:hypothetical protein
MKHTFRILTNASQNILQLPKTGQIVAGAELLYLARAGCSGEIAKSFNVDNTKLRLTWN